MGLTPQFGPVGDALWDTLNDTRLILDECKDRVKHIILFPPISPGRVQSVREQKCVSKCQMFLKTSEIISCLKKEEE